MGIYMIKILHIFKISIFFLKVISYDKISYLEWSALKFEEIVLKCVIYYRFQILNQ